MQAQLKSDMWYRLHIFLERAKFLWHRNSNPVSGEFTFFESTDSPGYLMIKLSQHLPDIAHLFGLHESLRTQVMPFGITFNDMRGVQRQMSFAVGNGTRPSGSCIPLPLFRDSIPKVSDKEEYTSDYVQAVYKDQLAHLSVTAEEKLTFDFYDRPYLFNEILLKLIGNLSSLLMKDPDIAERKHDAMIVEQARNTLKAFSNDRGPRSLHSQYIVNLLVASLYPQGEGKPSKRAFAHVMGINERFPVLADFQAVREQQRLDKIEVVSPEFWNVADEAPANGEVDAEEDELEEEEESDEDQDFREEEEVWEDYRTDVLLFSQVARKVHKNKVDKQFFLDAWHRHTGYDTFSDKKTVVQDYHGNTTVHARHVQLGNNQSIYDNMIANDWEYLNVWRPKYWEKPTKNGKDISFKNFLQCKCKCVGKTGKHYCADVIDTGLQLALDGLCKIRASKHVKDLRPLCAEAGCPSCTNQEFLEMHTSRTKFFKVAFCPPVPSNEMYWRVGNSLAEVQKLQKSMIDRMEERETVSSVFNIKNEKMMVVLKCVQ